MKILPMGMQNSFDLDVQILATDMARQKANPLYLAKSLDTEGDFKRLGELAYKAKFLKVSLQEEAYRLSRDFTPSNLFAFCRLMIAGRRGKKLVYLCPEMINELEASYFEGVATNMV